MKNTALLALLLLLSMASRGQTPQFKWAEQIEGGVTGDISVSSMTTDAFGNLYTTGTFDGTIDFDPGPGVDTITGPGFGDIYLTKMDSLGHLVWTKSIGGSSYDHGSSVTTDAAGNIYLAGFFSGDSVDFDPGPGSFMLNGGENSFVLKLDANGDFLWVKQLASISENYAMSAALDDQNNILVTGRFQGTADFDPGAGTDSLTSGSTDIYVWKVDNNGDLLWAKQIDVLSGTQTYSIASDPSGNIFIAGLLLGTTDLDPGTQVFNLTNAQLLPCAFLLKLNSSGSFAWAKKLDHVDIAAGGGNILIDAAGNLYLGGDFSGTVDFDPDAGTQILTSTSDSSSFLLKLDNNGVFSWVKHLTNVKGTALDDAGNIYTSGTSVSKFTPTGVSQWTFDNSPSIMITIDKFENVYTAGTFTGTFDFDPGPGVYNLTNTIGIGTFFQKLAQPSTSGVNYITLSQSSFNVSPNPASQLLYLQSDMPGDFKLINALGQIVKSVVVRTKETVAVNISELPAGVYFISDLRAASSKRIVIKY